MIDVVKCVYAKTEASRQSRLNVFKFEDCIATMIDMWRYRQVCSISTRLYTSLGLCDGFSVFKEWRMCVSSLARSENDVDRRAVGKASSKDSELPDDLLPVVRHCTF